MFSYVVVLTLAVAAVSAAPGGLLAGYAAPAVVTAHSSQVIARNYNGLAAPLVAAHYNAAPVAVAAPFAGAPLGAHVAAPYVAAPLAAHVAAPYVAAPLAAHVAAPYVAAPLAAHVAAPYAAAPYFASPSYYL